MKFRFKARTRGTDGALLDTLPWTLGALAFALLPHLPYLPVWVSAAFLICAGWRLYVEKTRRALPSPWLRAGLALACFFSISVAYSSISGVGPGSALLAVMASLKLLETNRRRDQFVLLFISIFLVMSSLLREQYLWSLPYLIMATLVIATAWLRMSGKRGHSVGDSVRTASRLMAYAAPLAIAMWILFPRLNAPMWAASIDSGRAVSGLANTMSPGSISSLSLSEAVAFRVMFDGDIPDPRDRYWRVLVLTGFNGRTWSGIDPEDGRSVRDQTAYRGDPVSYEITLEPTGQKWVPALDMPRQWDLPLTQRVQNQTLLRQNAVDQRIAYRATSYPDYRVAQSERWLAPYLRVNGNGNPRAAELAQTMRREAESDEVFVDEVLSMFREQAFYYTLEPPPLGRNPVDRFLFDTKRGFCEHYASAFAFMMRSAGVPSRVVLGYQGGEVNEMSGHLVVRQSSAHAWTEVYLPHAGWYRVDPTAAVAPERIEFSLGDPEMESLTSSWGFSSPSPILQNLITSWDALNAKWNDWVLGYGPEKQNRFLQLLGMDDPQWRSMLLTLIALVIAALIGIGVLMSLRNRPPKPDEAALVYRRFVRRSGLEPGTGETPLAFARRVTDNGTLTEQQVRTITDAYLAARYAEDHGGLTKLKRAVAAIR